MICLLDTVEIANAGLLTRIRRAIKKNLDITAESIVIYGIRVLYMRMGISPSMKGKLVRKRMRQAVDMMRGARVGSVLFSKNFPYRDVILREGFQAMDESALIELLAGAIAARCAEGKEAAVFFADRMTGSAERAFRVICRQYRYIMTVSPGNSRLFTELTRSLGISVLQQPTESQLLKAQVAVFFAPPLGKTVLSDSCIAVPVKTHFVETVDCRRVVTGVTIGLTGGEHNQVPAGFAAEPLVAAALEAGTLRLEDIQMTDLKITEKQA